MKSILRILACMLLALAAPSVVLTACSKSSAQATRYHCPMHPTYIAEQPGDCPICGMRLVPIDGEKPRASGASASADTSSGQEHVHPAASGQAAEVSTAGNVPGLATIAVSAEGLRLAGVRTAVAEQGRIARTIRAVGVVRPDETRVRHVHTKIAGWIEKLYVNFTGEPVAAGRPILTIFSQELLAAQHEYLQAKNAAGTMQKSDLSAVREGADDMLTASRRRLELLDVPKNLINELDQGAAVSRTVVVSTPVGGTVMSKNVFEGQQVEPGMELFTVTDLSRVWIEADIYESEAAAVHVGQESKITFANDPGASMSGRIKYIYPYLNAETRTLRVRFNFPNPGLKLKLESYANVEIPVETAEGAIIPDSAIMDTGVRQVVFVNTDVGRFEPRLVKVGIRSEGRAQILTGISPGERVAVKANFLLDSESRLRAALAPRAIESPAPSASAAHTGSHR
jgi:RND family efflux transporter MFP subunit